MTESPAVRPRIEGEREREILDAVIAVVLEVGYDKLTFDLVSQRAHAGKATLYRRWPSKESLVMAAIVDSNACHMRADAESLDTGSLLGDLQALLGLKEARRSAMPDLVGAVAPALQRDESLRKEFMATFAEPRVAVFRGMLQRAQERGEVRADLDVELVAQIVPAFSIHHTVTRGGPPDPDHMARVVEQVLLPAAGVTVSHPTPTERRG